MNASKRRRHCINFTRIAVVVLNQKVRPFTARWHARMLAGKLGEADRHAFRAELRGATCRPIFATTRALLADLADVEDLTDLEAVCNLSGGNHDHTVQQPQLAGQGYAKSQNVM